MANKSQEKSRKSAKKLKGCLNCPLCRSCMLVKAPSRKREWEE